MAAINGAPAFSQQPIPPLAAKVRAALWATAYRPPPSAANCTLPTLRLCRDIRRTRLHLHLQARTCIRPCKDPACSTATATPKHSGMGHHRLRGWALPRSGSSCRWAPQTGGVQQGHQWWACWEVVPGAELSQADDRHVRVRARQERLCCWRGMQLGLPPPKVTGLLCDPVACWVNKPNALIKAILTNDLHDLGCPRLALLVRN